MYGVYVCLGRNQGWLMEDNLKRAKFATKQEAEKWIKEWAVHKQYYIVKKGKQ